MGKHFSETQYYTLVSNKNGAAVLKTDDGQDVEIGKEYIEQCLVSADEFKTQKTVTRTEAANIFQSNPLIAMTVNFNTKVKEVDVLKEVMDAVGSASIKNIEGAVKSAIKKAINGEERTIVGRHYGELNEFGRMNFIDMEAQKDTTKNYDTRFRQVDPRTINWLIIKGVKYNVK
jgi:hypothetical protein